MFLNNRNTLLLQAFSRFSWTLSTRSLLERERAYVPTVPCSHILLPPLDPATLEPQHLVGIELGLALTLSAMLFTKYCGKLIYLL